MGKRILGCFSCMGIWIFFFIVMGIFVGLCKSLFWFFVDGVVGGF